MCCLGLMHPVNVLTLNIMIVERLLLMRRLEVNKQKAEIISLPLAHSFTQLALNEQYLNSMTTGCVKLFLWKYECRHTITINVKDVILTLPLK